MQDRDLVDFLQWALPHLRMRWPGFRKVRRQVGKRIGRRMQELRLGDLAAYRAHLDSHPGEWRVLDELCRITITRFWRDRDVWAALATRVLPDLVAGARAVGERELRAWCAGCAGGEEAYTLALGWALAGPGRTGDVALRILATDSDPALLARAGEAIYTPGCLKELPEPLRQEGFEPVASGGLRPRAPFRDAVTLMEHDQRTAPPPGRFRLVLCRNLAFTYFDVALQCEVLARLGRALVSGGALVVGRREALPEEAQGFVPWPEAPGVHRRA
jgi:chemotaxis protein methyltransferase CheR